MAFYQEATFLDVPLFSSLHHYLPLGNAAHYYYTD